MSASSRGWSATTGHARPSQAATTYARSSQRHERAARWFTLKRRHGSVILHHRTVHPVVIREWSTAMELFEGALFQAQRTQRRFCALS